MKTSVSFLALSTLALAVPAAARDSLGIYADWGAFRDPGVPRCYAIAKPRPSTLSREFDGFASIGTWPKRNVRSQIHFRLTRKMQDKGAITLGIGSATFALTGGPNDAWATDRTMDAAIVSAMRSAGSMTLSARDASGKRFSDTYNLSGAATAMDAATVGCARLK